MPDLNNIEYLEAETFEIPRGEALRALEVIEFLELEDVRQQEPGFNPGFN